MWWFQSWAEASGYAHARYALIAATAFAVSLGVGALLLRAFRARQVFEDTRQPDHQELNRIASQKKQVATMGGLMMLAGVLGSVLLWADVRSVYVLNGLFCVLALGGVGLADDCLKRRRAPKRGLSMRAKLAGQIGVGLITACVLHRAAASEGGARLVVPFLDGPGLDIGWWYVPWAVFLITATSNAVNLTDGLDGLAGGCTALATGGLLVAGLLLLRAGAPALRAAPAAAQTMCLLAAALIGSILGFLWYNTHPAAIFMGDTGSLALGGLLAYIALGLRAEAALIVAGAVLFADEATVALQIVGYKLTRKRLFPIAPIHHYFQTGLHWPEERITVRLWLLGALAALASLVLTPLGGGR